MLQAHPTDFGETDRRALARCIEECFFACARVCTACADACPGEETVAEPISCTRADLDCADICITTGRVLSRHLDYDTDLVRVALTAWSPYSNRRDHLGAVRVSLLHSHRPSTFSSVITIDN